MTSSPGDNAFDLERDLPLTTADVEALDRARNIPALGFEKYLQWLSEITNHTSDRRRMHWPDVPFEL
jgi:hypothetical protein